MHDDTLCVALRYHDVPCYVITEAGARTLQDQTVGVPKPVKMFSFLVLSFSFYHMDSEVQDIMLVYKQHL